MSLSSEISAVCSTMCVYTSLCEVVDYFSTHALRIGQTRLALVTCQSPFRRGDHVTQLRA